MPHCALLNNIVDQDHRFIKKRITASLGSRSEEGACRTIEGYEATHAIRKGQVRWAPKGERSPNATSSTESSASLLRSHRGMRTCSTLGYSYFQQNLQIR